LLAVSCLEKIGKCGLLTAWLSLFHKAAFEYGAAIGSGHAYTAQAL
jgi:hypothetical protein